MRYCKHCNGELREGMAFCPFCGQAIAPAPPSAAARNTKGTRPKKARGRAPMKGRRTVAILLGITGCMLALIAALYVFMLRPQADKSGAAVSRVTGDVGSGGGKAVAAYINNALASPGPDAAHGNDAPASPNSNGDADASIVEDVLLDNMRCQVEQSRADGATLSVGAPDMWELIDRIDREATSEEDFGRRLRAALEKGEFTLRTVTVEVSLDADGNIRDGYELIDAIYGGMLSKMDDLLMKGDAIS